MTATKKKEKVVWIVCTFREIYYVVLSSSYFLDNIELTNKYNLAHTIRYFVKRLHDWLLLLNMDLRRKHS